MSLCTIQCIYDVFLSYSTTTKNKMSLKLNQKEIKKTSKNCVIISLIAIFMYILFFFLQCQHLVYRLIKLRHTLLKGICSIEIQKKNIYIYFFFVTNY